MSEPLRIQAGFFVHGNREAWNVPSVTTNGSFNMQTTTTADLNMAQRIATILDTSYITSRVSNALDCAGLFFGNYSDFLALKLRGNSQRRAPAYLYEPGVITDLVQLVPGIGTNLQLAPSCSSLYLPTRYIICTRSRRATSDACGGA